MPKFEAHITCHIEHAVRVEMFGTLMGWKFSRIDGDALMGAKPYCYLTCYSIQYEILRAEVDAASRNLAQMGVPVLREKIEQIVYDTKTGVDEYKGA